MKNKSASKIAFAIAWIAIAILAGIVGYTIVDYQLSSENTMGNQLQNFNTVLENKTNEMQQNEIEEKNEIDNELQNEEVENTVEEGTTEEKDEPENSTLSNEEQAIEMAKEKYGEAEGVYYAVEIDGSAESEARYIVTVRETETTFALTSYVIDLAEGTIEEQ